MAEQVAKPDSPQDAPAETPVAAPRRGRKWLLVLALLAFAVWALPWIVGSTGLKNEVTRRVLPWLPPGANFEAPSLGWMSPVNLSKVKILDHDGRVLLECDHVTSQKSLWEMATSPRSPGAWDCENPKLFLRVGPNGTNLDPIVRDMLKRRGRGRLLELSVSGSEGHVEFLDGADHPTMIVDNVRFTYANAAQGGEVEVAGQVTSPADAGSLAVKGNWSVPAAANEIPAIDLRASIHQWPLAIVTPLLDGQTSIQDLAGQFSVSLQAAVTPSADGSAGVTGELKILPEHVQYRVAGSTEATEFNSGEIAATIDGKWNKGDNRIELPRFECQSKLFAISGAGQIDDPRGVCAIDLRGQTDRDLSSFLELLKPEVRRHIILTGLRLREWSVHGQLNPPPNDESQSLAIGGDVTWDTAEAFGITATPGSITADWRAGRIDFAANDVSINGGRLAALPRVVFASPTSLQADQGPILVDISFSEEQCRTWLKFLSPILANATSAEGQFTLALESGSMPVSDLQSAQAAGTLQIHSGRIGPGPIARRVLSMAGNFAELVTQKTPEWAERDIWLDLPQQAVRFRVEQGRVIHERLTFQVGELAMSTGGSVGFDESLDLVLEIPLPDAWLSRNKMLSRLKGEVVSIRIGGTLDDPAVDRRVLADFGKRLGAKAAGGLLQNLLEKGLDKAAEKAVKRKTPPSTP